MAPKLKTAKKEGRGDHCNKRALKRDTHPIVALVRGDQYRVSRASGPKAGRENEGIPLSP